MAIVRLSEIKPGERCRLHHMELYGGMRRRLLELGFLPEVQLHMMISAPSGSPKMIWCKNSMVAVRTKDCDRILVERCG